MNVEKVKKVNNFPDAEAHCLDRFKDEVIHHRETIEALMSRDSCKKGILIQNSEGKFWIGGQDKFKSHLGMWFKFGNKRIKKEMKKAKAVDSSAKLFKTY